MPNTTPQPDVRKIGATAVVAAAAGWLAISAAAAVRGGSTAPAVHAGPVDALRRQAIASVAKGVEPPRLLHWVAPRVPPPVVAPRPPAPTQVVVAPAVVAPAPVQTAAPAPTTTSSPSGSDDGNGGGTDD